jgi:hypothetical protein
MSKDDRYCCPICKETQTLKEADGRLVCPSGADGHSFELRYSRHAMKGMFLVKRDGEEYPAVQMTDVNKTPT